MKAEYDVFFINYGDVGSAGAGYSGEPIELHSLFDDYGIAQYLPVLNETGNDSFRVICEVI